MVRISPSDYDLGTYLEQAQHYTSMRQLAEALGIDQSHMSRYLRGEGWNDQVMQSLKGGGSPKDPHKRMRDWYEGEQEVEEVLNEIESYGTVPLEYGSDDLNEQVEEARDVIQMMESQNRRLASQMRKMRLALYQREQHDRQLQEIAAQVVGRVAPQGGHTIKYVARSTRREDWIALAPIADCHLGKYVWGKEGWGKDYDTDIACQRLEDHGRDIANWIRSEGGTCRKAYIPDVGDFFHAIDGQTQSGTLLHQDTRGKRVFELGFEARLAGIEHIRKACEEVEVLESEGNHDHQYHFNFYHSLEQYFRHTEDVTVRRSFSSKAYFRLGDCIHFFDHGKGIGKLGTANTREKIRLTVENLIPHEVLGSAKRVHFWCGHLHYRECSENGMYYVERLPSMAEPDDYEEDIRVATAPGAVAYRLDDKGFIQGTHNVYF